MKRRLLTVAIFLLLGAVVNAFVAWGAALRADYLWEWTTAEWVFGNDQWHGSDPGRFELRPDAAFIATDSCVEATKLVQYHILPDDPGAFGLSVRAGWPALGFTGEMWASAKDGWQNRFVSGAVDLETPGPGSRWRLIPWRPLWPGFAANTMLYAAMLWLLARAWSWIRQYLRARRGLCPGCGYPAGSSPVCTECGHQLPSHAATS